MSHYANRILFFIVFVLPLIVIAYYEVAVATDRYQSEAALIISQEKAGTTTFDVSFLGLPSSADDKDARVVEEFIMSRDMLHFLDDKHHLREHYSASRVDWLARLSNTASFEDFHQYMAGYIILTYDTESKIIHIQLQSFDANYSKALTDSIVARSQLFIDSLNERMTAEQTRFFDDKMVESETRLKEAKQALLTFQQVNRLLTTESESALVLQNISALETAMSKQKSELDSAASVLSNNAPRLQQMRADIAALENQIKIEKERLSGSSTSSLTELDARYRDIQLNLEFVTTMYKSNLSQLEQARIEAARRIKFLIVVSAPSLADESQFPSRAYIIITSAIVLLILYFIASLVMAVAREHG